jgi:putative hydrolase of the HAD superfamily
MWADIRAVLFDLDGTLLDRRRSLEHFAREQWARLPFLLNAVDQSGYVDTFVELDCDGYSPRDELFRAIVARFNLADGLAKELRTDFRASFPRACRLFPDATETLTTLRASGLKLGLVTNGSVRMQSGKIEHLALASMFDTMLISDAEGCAKPDVRIFHRALERLDVRPEHAVFVGDHPEVDVAGARAAGMRAIWRRSPRWPGPVEADAVIEEAGELVRLLRPVPH